jgi:hypothetical protein
MARRRNRFHNTIFWRVPCILSTLISGMHSASVRACCQSLYRFMQVFHRLFLHWLQALHAICSSRGPGWREEESSLPPSISYKSPLSPSPRRCAQHPEIIHMLGTCTVRKKSASQPICKTSQSIVHISQSILFISQALCLMFFFVYMPPAPFCTCVKYCLLVVFHAAMYFSMQLV